MKVEIITIGDEILIGQIVDTNSAWMAVELNKAGFEIEQISSVHDREDHIIQALDLALSRADIVLFTGGIGPTKDDITKFTLCKYFDSTLVFNQEVLTHIENLLRHRQRAINELTRTQAMVPDKATLIPNRVGTAPITWYEKDSKVVVSMPGVPYEMKEAMSTEIIPRLQQRYATPDVIHRTILVRGLPESALAIRIADWENSLPEAIRLAYLPNFNLVKLRLSTVTTDKEATRKELDTRITMLRMILGDAILAEEDVPAEKLVVEWMSRQQLTLSTAESCTGGFIAHRITSVPGSSAMYKGSVVAYDNRVKQYQLKVDEQLLIEHGAVSSEVASAMARGIRELVSTDFAIATTGIAGPDGGTAEKPVGTVWIALADAQGVVSKQYRFQLGRQLNIERTTQTAFLLLLDKLRGIPDEELI
ncbi:MAG: competence/damage-inducible protein A [Paludibacter sp.]|jgi:nicotinamide-nucleotide amidase|nr:competence/damage-inducible protein A [Paludibacter sp.]